MEKGHSIKYVPTNIFHALTRYLSTFKQDSLHVFFSTVYPGTPLFVNFIPVGIKVSAYAMDSNINQNKMYKMQRPKKKCDKRVSIFVIQGRTMREELCTEFSIFCQIISQTFYEKKTKET